MRFEKSLLRHLEKLGPILLVPAFSLISACDSNSNNSGTVNEHIPPTVNNSSLPRVTSGALPGPEALYAPALYSPQLENLAPWSASPILVSGAWSYRKGEFLYQDFLFDDYGAAGTRPQKHTAVNSRSAGTLVYPSSAVYANNAADLVEFRIKPLENSTAVRVTLNTMLDPDVVAFTLAIDSSAEKHDWPFNAGVVSPARWFVTVQGKNVTLHEAGSTTPLTSALTVNVDKYRRQFDVRIPHVIWNPGRRTVPLRLGVGLWDRTRSSYLIPETTGDATTPGGSAPNQAALFNLAFRFNEPYPNNQTFPASPPEIALRLASNTYWRDEKQAEALAAGDVTGLVAQVDFDKLIDEVNDDSGIPKSGLLNRIYASSFEPFQGVDPAKTCDRFPTSCDGRFGGQLQPYALYIPERKIPDGGWGLSLLLHALSANHNSYSGTTFPEILGERNTGAVVLTPLSRGPDGDYTDLAELDIFEAWADVARHYPLDPGWVVSTGYSMGGGGTYKMLSRWPDLFARGMAGGAVPRAEQGGKIEAFRNIPIMIWMGSLDASGVPIVYSTDSQDALTSEGLSYVFDLFYNMDHFTLVYGDFWSPVADFLAAHRVDRNPHRISYVVDPTFDSERAGLVANHAYWASNMRVRNPMANQQGSVDIRSYGFGLGSVTLSGAITSYGVFEGGHFGPLPYERTEQSISLPVSIEARDRIEIEAENISYLTIDVKRARVSCDVLLDVYTDGPLEVELADCNRTEYF